MSTEIKNNISQQFAEVANIIRTTQNNVFRVANTALINLYWQVGKYISERITLSEWGDGVVEQLADYIAEKIPEAKGFSARNLWRMKAFFESYYIDGEKLTPLVSQISWTNNLLILSRVKDLEAKEFYLKKCISERWSKRELDRQISSFLYERVATASPLLSTVLKETSPDASEVFRDQYVMEFIGGKSYSRETDLKRALIKHMKEFVLELGKDFIFIDEEYRLQVGNSDFRIDLLFYHRELQCLVAFELKMEAFKPEHLGQLNFYLEALDRDVKKAKENPSIGVLLCTDKDNEVVEYALSRSLSPTMVAEYQLCLPDKSLLQKKMKQIVEMQIE